MALKATPRLLPSVSGAVAWSVASVAPVPRVSVPAAAPRAASALIAKIPSATVVVLWALAAPFKVIFEVAEEPVAPCSVSVCPPKMLPLNVTPVVPSLPMVAAAESVMVPL